MNPYLVRAGCCLGLALLISLVSGIGAPLQARFLPVKRAGPTAADGSFDARQLIVKFKDGMHFHAVEGRLTNAVAEEIAPVQSLLNSIPKAHWQRVDKISEEQMEAMRQAAQIRLGRALPDLNQEFRVFLPADTNAAPVIDALN